MRKMMEGRLNVNWDAYWKGFMSFPFVEAVRFSLVRAAYERLLRSFSIGHNPKFCELGAGTASVSRYLGDKYKAEITIVDSNPQAIQLAQRNFENYPSRFLPLNCDVFELRPYHHQFDLVHSGGLIEHFINEAREAIVRVHCDLVKEEGYLLIFVPTYNIWYRLLNEGVFKFLHLLDKVPEVPWSFEELSMLLKQYGFYIMASTHVVTELGVLAKRIS